MYKLPPPRHRSCECDEIHLSKPRHCFRSRKAAENEAKRSSSSENEMEARPCMMECHSKHWHVYSKTFLLHCKLVAVVNRMGVQEALRRIAGEETLDASLG